MWSQPMPPSPQEMPPPPEGMPNAFQPYAPPATPADPRGSDARGSLPGAAVPLYSANQVALATFFGTVLGGSIVLALNERRLGRSQAALVAVALGVLGTLVVVGLAFVLPDGAPSAPFGLVSILALRAIAARRQQALFDQHVGFGGKRASSWAAFGLGLASLVVVFVPIFVILAVAEYLSPTPYYSPT